MEKEFNLSEKRIGYDCGMLDCSCCQLVIPEDSVKDFIRLLKEDIDSNGCCMSCKDRIKQTINQRAGDKLK